MGFAVEGQKMLDISLRNKYSHAPFFGSDTTNNINISIDVASGLGLLYDYVFLHCMVGTLRKQDNLHDKVGMATWKKRPGNSTSNLRRCIKTGAKSCAKL